MKSKLIQIVFLLFCFLSFLTDCESVNSYSSEDDDFLEPQRNLSHIDPRFVITKANVYGRIYRETSVYDDIRTVNLDNSCNESNPSSGITGLTNWSIKLYDDNWNLVTSGFSTSDFNNGAGWFQLGSVDAPGNYYFVVTDSYGNIYMGLEYGKAVSNYLWSISYPAGYNSCTAINCTGGVPEEFLVYPEFADSKVVIHHDVYSFSVIVDIYVKNCSPVLSVTTSGESSYGTWNDITVAPGDSCLIGVQIFSTSEDIFIYASITESSPPDEVASNNYVHYRRKKDTQY